MTTLFEILDDPSAPLVDWRRMRLAFLVPHSASMVTRDLAIDDATMLAAASQIAGELPPGGLVADPPVAS